MTQERTRTPEDLFADAGQLLDAALQELEGGDIRQAAEKAWCATKRATDALILARTGEEPRTSGQTTRRIRQLALIDPAISSIAVDFANRAWVLHGSCFYDGQCEPQESIAADIRATSDLIQLAQQLASSG